MERHARQSRLAEIGAEGQARVARASVDVALDGLAGEVAVRYLAGAGVARVCVRTRELADAARAVDARVVAEVDANLPAGAPPPSLPLEDATARELAAGALEALSALRRALEARS